jgi:UDP-3-O-[3-hydroxymyristoyl] glucosamine N-acyltransferase
MSATQSITAQELAVKVNGTLTGNPAVVVAGVAGLDEANEQDVSFLGNRKYASQLAATKASTVLVEKDFTGQPRPGQAFIACANSTVAFSQAIALFAPPPPSFPPGIHPAAVVAPTATIGAGAHIGPCAVIDERAVIGAGTVIAAGCYIGQDSVVGEKSLLYANVSIRERCRIGSRVIIHPGSVIGSDGFGFAPDGRGGLMKIPQVGIVQIDDDVEIGGNCTIDRARFGRTWLKRGVKLDNQVHIAHNVVVGEWSLLIGQCGIAGSTEIGRGVIVAAQAGINGHITIGDGARVGGTSGVVRSLPPGATVIGTPAESQREFVERLILPKKLRQLQDRVATLEAALAASTGQNA